MKTTVMNECGLYESLLGLSLSYGKADEYVVGEKDMQRVAEKLLQKHLHSGECKWMESVVVWLDVTAPRYWWSQFDTYRAGITKQSESTMHTLTKKPLTYDDFEDFIPITVIDYLNRLIADKSWHEAKALLPESFLQRRIICTNYKALAHIYAQRHDHRLPQWHLFCEALKEQLEYPQFINREWKK